MNEDAQIVDRMVAMVREIAPAKFRKGRIDRQARLQNDIGLDSLAVASLMFRVETEFGLDLGSVGDLAAQVGALRTVGDLVDFVVALKSTARTP